MTLSPLNCNISKRLPVAALCLGGAALLTAAAPSFAQTPLLGKPINVSSVFSNGTSYIDGGTQTITTGGETYSPVGGPYFPPFGNLTTFVTPDQAVFQVNGGYVGFAGAPFPGILISGQGGSPFQFTTVLVDPSTTVTGLDNTRVSLSNGGVFFDTENLNFKDGQKLVLNFSPGDPSEVLPPPVPEASGAASLGLLLALGAAAVLAPRLRKRKAQEPGIVARQTDRGTERIIMTLLPLDCHTSRRRPVAALCLGGAALLTAAVPALAQTPLLNQTIHVATVNADLSTFIDNGTQTITSGGELFHVADYASGGQSGNFDVTITPDQAVFRDTLFPFAFFGTGFAGFYISGAGATPFQFTTVLVDPSSTVAGLDNTRVSLRSGGAFFNPNGLFFQPGQTLVLNFSPGDPSETLPSPVPEASTTAGLGLLLALGAAAMLAPRLRKRKAQE